MQEWMKKEKVKFMEYEDISDDCRRVRDLNISVNETAFKINATATMHSNIDEAHLSYRKVMAFKIYKEIPGAVVNIYKSILEHVEEM